MACTVTQESDPHLSDWRWARILIIYYDIMNYEFDSQIKPISKHNAPKLGKPCIIIFIALAPNHFRQRRIVDSSAATVISALPRLIASSKVATELLQYIYDSRQEAGDSIFYATNNDLSEYRDLFGFIFDAMG